MKGNNGTWMKFAEVNEGKHFFFFFATKMFPPCDPSSLAAASFHSVPVAASLFALAECGLSWFLRKPCCLTHLLATQTGAWPSGLPHLQESISATCSERSSGLQFSANYLNFCNFDYLVLGCVWVGSRTFEDTINLPKSWLLLLLLLLQHKDIWCKNRNKIISDFKTMNLPTSKCWALF